MKFSKYNPTAPPFESICSTAWPASYLPAITIPGFPETLIAAKPQPVPDTLAVSGPFTFMPCIFYSIFLLYTGSHLLSHAVPSIVSSAA